MPLARVWEPWITCGVPGPRTRQPSSSDRRRSRSGSRPGDRTGPSGPWESEGRHPLPDPETKGIEGDPSDVPEATREQVTEHLRDVAGVAFDVSTNHPPYRGVRGHGRAAVAADPDKAVLRDLLERYLGGTDSTLAGTLLADERDEVRIRVHPLEVYTWDYTDRMRGVSDR